MKNAEIVDHLVQGFLSMAHELLDGCQDEAIPVDLYDFVPDFWDEWFEPFLEGWSPELHRHLTDAFMQEMQRDETGITARYTALAFYDGLRRFLTDSHWEAARPEPPESVREIGGE